MVATLANGGVKPVTKKKVVTPDAAMHTMAVMVVFLSDNLQWSAQTIVDLYRCRWQIEVFFKEIKQTLQLADFLGHNANAVRWQV